MRHLLQGDATNWGVYQSVLCISGQLPIPNCEMTKSTPLSVTVSMNSSQNSQLVLQGDPSLFQGPQRVWLDSVSSFGKLLVNSSPLELTWATAVSSGGL